MGYFIWPTVNKHVTSKYGYRNLNIKGSSKYHKGIDIGGPAGNDIYAARSGVVTISKTGYNGGRGYYVVVKHSEQYETLYQHCSKLLVKVGDRVAAGQVIAKVGSTGIGSGAHLHFEIHDLVKKRDATYGNTVDPLKYVSPSDTLKNISDTAVFTGSTSSSSVDPMYSTGKDTVIFIGDSRTVGMKQYVGKNLNIWSAKSGEGYKWMTTLGVPAIEGKVSSNTAVCFWIGINDMLYVSGMKYATYINNCAYNWVAKGASVYFVSVGPVRRQGYGILTNEKIQAWNQSVRDNLGMNVGYIDAYSAIIDSFETVDGLHYNKQTSLDVYNLILESAKQGTTTLYCNSSVIGGSPYQMDYTKLNPYVVTIDRATSASLNYSKLKLAGVVGAILEAGYLYTPNAYNEVYEFKQPRFDVQLNNIIRNNIEFGFFFVARAKNEEQARSELYWLSFIVRQHPPKLGVWVQLDFPSKSRVLNNKIVDCYQKGLYRLGLAGKIGFYTTKESLKWFNWENYQDRWFMWIVDHVDSASDLEQLLTPEFFDLDGVG